MSTLGMIKKIVKELCFNSFDKCDLNGLDVPLPERLADLSDSERDWVFAAAKSLTHVIYNIFYLQQPWRPDGELHLRIQTIEQQEHGAFARLLREANVGSGWLASGWRIVEREGTGRWIATDGRVTLAIREEEIFSKEIDVLDKSQQVSILFPKHLPYMSPGYYMAISNAGMPGVDNNPIVRIYVNVKPGTAPALLRSMTSFVCSRGLRAIIKILNHPDSFGRPDAAVVYLERDAFIQLCSELREIVARFAPNLSDSVPGFTKRWMLGVGIAEEPERKGEVAVSFGEHRSRLIAVGLARAYVKFRDYDTEDIWVYETLRMAEVLTTLTEAGLDPERLYLNSSSEDVYPSELAV